MVFLIKAVSKISEKVGISHLIFKNKGFSCNSPHEKWLF